jgi:predicted RNase H-like HicB family nuclease
LTQFLLLSIVIDSLLRIFSLPRGDKEVQLTAVFMPVPEGYIAFVEELPGANTQGATIEEARENLNEAVQLVLEANRELTERSLVGTAVSREPFVLSTR